MIVIVKTGIAIERQKTLKGVKPIMKSSNIFDADNVNLE
jgi:hypothetical protein